MARGSQSPFVSHVKSKLANCQKYEVKCIVYKHTQCYPSIVQLAGLILKEKFVFSRVSHKSQYITICLGYGEREWRFSLSHRRYVRPLQGSRTLNVYKTVLMLRQIVWVTRRFSCLNIQEFPEVILDANGLCGIAFGFIGAN